MKSKYQVSENEVSGIRCEVSANEVSGAKYQVSGWENGREGAFVLRDEVRDEIPQWKLVETTGIKWVRLVHDRRGVYGIGFMKEVRGVRCQVSGEQDEQLVYFLGNQITHGLVRRISAFESMVLLHCLAGRELNLQPDVESNSYAWKKWLSMLMVDR